MRILFAEDERDLNDIVSKKLTSDGYSVDSCHDGLSAWAYLQAAEYDGLVLDVMMPGMDGLTLLKKLRAGGKTLPVLLLTARDAVADRVEGLDSGANDYLVKPFALDELSARLRAMLRAPFGMAENILRAGTLQLDCAKKTLQRDGEEISLSAKEFSLLEYLMRNRGVVLSREKIENHVWNFDYEGGTNVVDVYIRYLRKKIDEGQQKKYIHTVRGLGYVFKEEKT